MCWRCDHPEATDEEYLEYLGQTIERDQWVVQYGENKGRPLAYTVGLHGLGLPELLVTGLPEQKSKSLLHSAAHEMACHDAVVEPATLIDFENGELLVEVVEVDHPAVMLKVTAQFYRHPFRALQLVWTDDERHWPWDRGWSRGRRLQQPVFGVRSLGRLAAG